MKNMKYFEDKLNALSMEFEEYKNKCKRAPETGEIIELAGFKWKILEKVEEGYFCILEGFENLSRKFDTDTNDWKASDLRNYLNVDFKNKIEKDIGVELVEFKRDLLSLDGQTEYSDCVDKVSLLNVDEYRKYRKMLPNTDKWWWLCSPWSTKCNGYEYSVAVVSPSGVIYYFDFFISVGVRPVCIFPLSIFESGEE